MHGPKMEFQVLDSSWPLSRTLETVEALVCATLIYPTHYNCFSQNTKYSQYFQRAQIAADIDEFNTLAGGTYPDVSSWPIRQYDMPQQTDQWVLSACSIAFWHTLYFRIMVARALLYRPLTFYNFLFFRNSCGIFVMKCMELWDGERWTGELNQVRYFFWSVQLIFSNTRL